MPRFYFHILNGKDFYDEIGEELPDIEAVKVAAIKLTGAVLTEGLSDDFWQGTAWQMVVSDKPAFQKGRTFLTVTLSSTEEARDNQEE